MCSPLRLLFSFAASVFAPVCSHDLFKMVAKPFQAAVTAVKPKLTGFIEP